jgi:hypothetical protein
LYKEGEFFWERSRKILQMITITPQNKIADKTSFRAKHWFFVVSVIALMAINSSLSAASKGTEIIKGDFNFGYVPYGKVITHRATFVNHTDSLLHVLQASPKCGCTRLVLPQTAASTGETLSVEINLDLAKTAAGEFVKSPEIQISDPAMNRVAIRLSGFSYRTGDIAASIRVEPGIVEFAKGTSETRVEIRNLGSFAVNVRPVMLPDKSLIEVVMPSAPIPAGKSAEIRLKRKPAKSPTAVHEYLTFSLTDDKMSRFTVPITADE